MKVGGDILQLFLWNFFSSQNFFFLGLSNQLMCFYDLGLGQGAGLTCHQQNGEQKIAEVWMDFLFLLHCGGWWAGSAVIGTSASKVETFWSILASSWLTELLRTPLESCFSKDYFSIEESILRYLKNHFVEEIFQRETIPTQCFLRHYE